MEKLYQTSCFGAKQTNFVPLTYELRFPKNAGLGFIG